jgi:hypothetical protein
MVIKHRWAEHYSACRLQLDLASLVRMSFLIGFCSGTGFIPLLVFLNAGAAGKDVASTFVLIVLAPLIGALNGALSGLVGYPLYRWLSLRSKGQSYTGIFVGLVAERDTA